ncbi:MAG: hypothetical protein ACRD8A_03805 [Candidatus Acidiferrales bacterium]
MRAHTIVFAILALAMMAVLPLGSQGAPQKAAAVASTVNRAGVAAKSNQASADQEFSLAEGEKRFHQNCGRCHVAPDKFPPRVMATVLRHMRVRATITDRDAKLILWYMTR